MVNFTVHPTDEYSIGDALFAIIPNDDGPGYLVGEMAELVALRDTLSRIIADPAAHDGIIHHLDERLGWTWLSVSEAAAEYDVPVATARWAAAHGKIGGAEKQFGRWRFPRATFLGWLLRNYRGL